MRCFIASASINNNMAWLKSIHPYNRVPCIVHHCYRGRSVEYMVMHGPVSIVFQAALPELLQRATMRVFC